MNSSSRSAARTGSSTRPCDGGRCDAGRCDVRRRNCHPAGVMPGQRAQWSTYHLDRESLQEIGAGERRATPRNRLALTGVIYLVLVCTLCILQFPQGTLGSRPDRFPFPGLVAGRGHSPGPPPPLNHLRRGRCGRWGRIRNAVYPAAGAGSCGTSGRITRSACSLRTPGGTSAGWSRVMANCPDGNDLVPRGEVVTSGRSRHAGG
jgi:hypothetical protein